MESVHDDRFVVFALQKKPGSWDDQALDTEPELAEQEVASCASYQEACHVRRKFHAAARSCVIRYVGPTGAATDCCLD